MDELPYQDYRCRNWLKEHFYRLTWYEVYDFIEFIVDHHENMVRYSSYRRDELEELSCSVFGHICPVFFSAEPFTETKEDRRISRNIPRDVMLKVVRRDGQVCRACHKNVSDDKIEFDHVIPHSRGGPTTPENLRILCRECNRKKSEALKEILADDPLRK